MKRKIGVLLSYVMMIFEVLSTLLLTPFIIRTLGQAEYGVYKLSASVVAYVFLLDLGVGNAITRYIAKFRAKGENDNEKRFLGIATVYYAVIAVIAIICGIVLIVIFPNAFAKGLSAEEIVLGQKLLAITMLNAAVTLGTAAYINVIVAYENFTISKGVTIVQIIIRIVLTFIMLKCGAGSIGIVTVNLCMTILCRLFFVYYVLFKIKLIPTLKNIDFGMVREIVTYSSMIFLQMLSTQINATVDQILIGSLVAASSVILAVYSVGTQVTQYFQSIGSAFNGVLMPGIVNMVEKGADSKALTDEMIRIGRIIFCVLGVIWGGFLVFGQQFINLWAGYENSEAYIVAVILMTAYMFILVESIGSQILWAKNLHKEQSVLKISIVLLNILLTVILIKWKPLLGATIGTFISLFLGDIVVMNVVFRKKLGINLWYYYKSLFKGIVPSILITVVAGFLFSLIGLTGWFGLALNIAVVCVVYLTLMLLFGMNVYEKRLVTSILKKFQIIRGK